MALIKSKIRCGKRMASRDGNTMQTYTININSAKIIFTCINNLNKKALKGTSKKYFKLKLPYITLYYPKKIKQ